MKSTPTKSVPALGMDERLKTQQGAASLIRNCRIADNGMGWTNDRGWEPLIPEVAGRIYKAVELNSVIGGFVWERSQGSEVYYLQENLNGPATSQLFYLYGNRGTNASHLKVRVGNADRRKPKPDDAGTQYVPFGRFLLIMNGTDPMWKFWGRGNYKSFGFSLPTPAPDIAGVDVEYQEGHATALDRPRPSNNSISLVWPAAHTDPLGLGESSDTINNSFEYRVSFITDTGSESPMSAPTTVSWIDTPATSPAHTTLGKYAVLINSVPIGPDGTVARRIYRTKNLRGGSDGAGSTLYYLTQLNDNTTNEYVDVHTDGQLGSEASITDSVLISGSYKFGAAWNGRMWIGGGETNPTRIIYSKQGLPEQFGMSNYFEVGVRDGGHITGIYPYYNNLLVFREKAIDMIQYNNGNYTISTVSSDLGTTAINSVTNVPGFGLVFLSYDGFYTIEGGTSGGSTVNIKKISNEINEEMARLTTSALASSTAVYSPKEKEYWCHYAADGVTRPIRGAVLHTGSKAWSLRNNDSKNQDSTIVADGGFEFNWLSTTPTGWIVLGPHKKVYVAGAFNGASAVRGNVGLQIWSAANQAGTKVTASVDQGGNYTITGTAVNPKGDSIYSSAWDDYGNSSIKKRVLSVELEGVGIGYNPLQLEYAVNWKDTYTSASDIYPVEPETESTTSSDFIFGPITDPAVQVPEALFDTGKWEDDRLINLRWDVKTGLITNFKWRIKDNDLFFISTYKTNIVSSTRNTIASGAGNNNNG